MRHNLACPVNITPVASAHAATKPACNCRTAGPSKRTFVSRHDPLVRPSPNHLSSMPKPPVHRYARRRRCRGRASDFPRWSWRVLWQNGSTTIPAVRRASRSAVGMPRSRRRRREHDAHTGRGPFDQDLLSVRPSVLDSVVQLKRDRLLRRSQVFPESRKRAVAVQQHLDDGARVSPAPSPS